MASSRSKRAKSPLLTCRRALAGNVDAALAGGFLRAIVGRLTHMPIAEPRRVDLEQVEHALLCRGAPECALRHGRAADIAETDEQETVLHHARSIPMRHAPHASLPGYGGSVAAAEQEEAMLRQLLVRGLRAGKGVAEGPEERRKRGRSTII